MVRHSDRALEAQINDMTKSNQNKSWINPYIMIGQSSHGGKGMFATDQIMKGEKILVWGGLYTNAIEAEKAREQGKLVMQWDDNVFSIEDRGDDDAYFINHSCRPNVWMEDAVTLTARKDIQSGEEITADYALWEHRPDYVSQWDCKCNELSCRGKVRGVDWMRPELQQLYAGHFSPLLNKRIKEKSS
jgi:hypothetical protein